MYLEARPGEDRPRFGSRATNLFDIGNSVRTSPSPRPLQPQKIPVGSALISRSIAPKSGVGGRGS